MIKEDFCSFDVAKLLKEKGFDETCYACYEYFSSNITMYSGWPFEYKGEVVNNSNDRIKCPTHQMAMKWLREVHQLHISVDVSPIYGKVKDEKGRNTCGLLYWHYMASGEWMNDKYNPQQKAFVVSAKSYEEAIEAALKYSLENLI